MAKLDKKAMTTAYAKIAAAVAAGSMSEDEMFEKVKALAHKSYPLLSIPAALGRMTAEVVNEMSEAEQAAFIKAAGPEFRKGLKLEKGPKKK